MFQRLRVTYFYPRPPRGGRRLLPESAFGCQHISIHALREEGDSCRIGKKGGNYISIHALREEGDYIDPTFERNYRISIHALREEGDPSCAVTRFSSEISIHALREEGDWARRLMQRQPEHFYPRPPRGGRLACAIPKGQDQDISIHALREEGDTKKTSSIQICLTFLSTPSARRATSYTHHNILKHLLFLSTPSARRATRSSPRW